MKVDNMKKHIPLISVLCFALFALLSCYKMVFTPVKYALKQSDLDSKEAYFLIKWIQVTGSDWMIIGDQNGLYEHPLYIIADGKIPSVVSNYAIATGHNTYICYGSYEGEADIGGGHFLSKYHFTDWDILYPVQRNGLIPFMPKGYLCKWDFVNTHRYRGD